MTNIMWNYLDKREATVAALKDYNDMQFIINDYQNQVHKIKEKMLHLQSPKLGSIPNGTGNDNATETRLISGITKLDKVNERYQVARDYFDWFEPAWQQLTDEERFVLDSCYRIPNQSLNHGLTVLMDKYFIAKTTAYNKKNKALEHLTLLLYGSHH